LIFGQLKPVFLSGALSGAAPEKAEDGKLGPNAGTFDFQSPATLLG
jgi:hypothetical protein